MSLKFNNNTAVNKVSSKCCNSQEGVSAFCHCIILTDHNLVIRIIYDVDNA